MFNAVLFNPAYSGSQQALNITGLYRTQWVGIEGAPEARSFSAHSPLKNKKVSLGIVAENERIGLFDKTRLSLLYAYRVKIGNGHLSLGLSAAYSAYNTNWNKIITTDGNDPSFNQGIQRQTAITGGAGLYYQREAFYFGLSVPGLFTNNRVVQNDRPAILNSGFLVDLTDQIKLKPAVLMMYLPNSPTLANLSGTFYYKELVGLGLGYTYKSSVNAILDLKINDQLRVGYGYEYSASALRYYTAGSHEIMLRYVFSYKVKAVSARYF